MTRPLLNLLTVLSLLLCAAVCVLWVRSYAYNETVGWYTNEWQGTHLRTTVYGLSSDSGGLLVFGLHRRAQFTAADDAFDECKLVNPNLSLPNYRRQTPVGYPYMARNYAGWGTLGFGCYWGQRSPPVRATPSYPMPSVSTDDRLFVVPYWFLAAMASLALVRRLLGLRKQLVGHCPCCGYDLRATPGRCPECGNNASVNPIT